MEVISKLLGFGMIISIVLIAGGLLKILFTKEQDGGLLIKGFLSLCVLGLLSMIFDGQVTDDSGMNIIFIVGGSIGLWHLGRAVGGMINRNGRNSELNTGNFVLKHIVAPVIVGVILFAITGETSTTLITVPIVGVVYAAIGIG